MIRKFTASSILAVAAAYAQAVSVPSTYQPVYSELQTKLNNLQSTVNASWNGQKGDTIYSSELLNANSNSGKLLLLNGVRDKYLQELQGFQALGVQAVVVKMGFPFLYQPFLVFNGDPNDFDAIKSFYQQVVADAHSYGMKCIVESSSIFPGFFSSGSGLNVAGYYAQLSYGDYLSAVATMNQTIVNEIHPDFLNLGSEPQTEAENTGYTQLASPTGWASAIQQYGSMIPAPHPIPLGAGVGTWEIDNSSQIVAALIPVVDYIDLHIYPINDPPFSSVDIPTNTINLINQVNSAGKRVAVSEAWLLKVSDENYPTSGVASSVNNFSLDSYSFWAPLDQAFVTAFYDLANWKDMIYFSAFWSRYYWAYVDYNSHSGLAPTALINASIQSAATALNGGQVTPTGQAVKSLVASNPAPAVVNAASFVPTGAPANSLVAIFGVNLATSTQNASGSLPTSLGGTTVTVLDSTGHTTTLPLVFASPNQINAFVPGGVAQGLATVTITPDSGQPYIGTMNVSASLPGLFAQSGAGTGVASAQVYTIASDGSVTYSSAFQTASGGGFTTAPINVSDPSTQVFLLLYGTGIAGRSSTDNVTATINGTAYPVSYAGPQNTFSGLDQVNVLLPSSLAGLGVVNLSLTVDGFTSNTVQIQIQ